MAKTHPLPDAAETTPTPPGSGPKLVGRDVDALIEHYAHVRSVDELPPELRDNPLIRAIVEAPPEHAASWDALREADELYTDDEGGARELADLEAGRHPLQRGGQHLDVVVRLDAELAELRQRRGG